MPEFLLEDVELAVSKQAETALNTNYTAIADFQRVLVSQPVVPIPTPDKSSDAGRVGNGHEFITPGRLCNTYWQQPNITLEDDIDFDMSGKLFRRALGSVVTTATVGAFVSKVVQAAAEGVGPAIAVVGFNCSFRRRGLSARRDGCPGVSAVPARQRPSEVFGDAGRHRQVRESFACWHADRSHVRLSERQQHPDPMDGQRRRARFVG